MKRKNLDLRRLLPAAAASVIAVFGLSSCAVLEMLDSLAAEEESLQNADIPLYVNDTDSAADTVSATDTGTSAPEASPAESASGTTAQDSFRLSSEAEGIISGLIGDSSRAEGSTAPVQTAPPPQTSDTEPDSPITPLAGDGSNISGSDSSIFAPEGYTPDDSSSGSDITSPYPAQQSPQLSLYLAYSELLNKYSAYIAKDGSFKREFCKYYITDIDDNGIPELLVETGTIEADRTIYVYTFDGSDTVSLGDFVSWHTRLGEGDGVLYTETSAMGSYLLSTITIQDGKLFTQREEQPSAESQLTMPLIGYDMNDTAALDALR